MIISTAKMACVASVERGNCLLVSLESFESEKRFLFMSASQSVRQLG